MLERAAIERAYRAYGHSVLRRARSILGSEADALEVLQDVFAALLREPEAVIDPQALVSWLYRATTNRCLNRIRNHKTRGRLLDERVAPAVPESVGSSGEFRVRHDLRRLLAALPEQEATALVHHEVDEMSHREISELMGCSRRHVGNLLERGRQKLRDSLTLAEVR